MRVSDSLEGDGPWDQVPRKRHVPHRQAAFHTEGVRSACSVAERLPPPKASPRWLAGPCLHTPVG